MSNKTKYIRMKASALLPSLLILIFIGCKKPEPLQFRGLQNFSVKEISTDSATLISDVVFYNPNQFSVELKNIESDFYANDHLLSHYNRDTLIKVPAATEMKIPVKLRVSLQPILNNALAAFLNQEINLRAKGKTKIGSSGVFITIPFEFSKNQKFSFF